ncbi:uncharacterized protein RJT21DRAFT_17403 [Scheffersomyces amazonensis]|uniref:uncharacterized protein n=1 Tax=Scheffersomyces amazonensis TaxID=1078765 RepID=UPI00315D5C46
MKLTEIITLDYAYNALVPVMDGVIQPFIISRECSDRYYKLKDELEEYLKSPDITEVDKLLEEFWLLDLVEDGRIERDYALKVLLRLVNFHLLLKIEMETNETLNQVIDSFRCSGIFRKWFPNKTRFIVSYFNFTISLSLQLPKMESSKPIQKRKKVHSLNQILRRYQKKDTYRSENLHWSGVLPLNLGTFYPIYGDIKDFEFDESSLKLVKEQILEIELKTYFYHNSLYHKGSVAYAITDKLTCWITSSLLSTIYNETIYSTQEYSFKRIMERGEKIVEPDIVLQFKDFAIPIKVRYSNILDYINNCRPEKISMNSFGFTNIFGQLLWDAISTKCPYVLLSNYYNTFVIDLRNHHLNDFNDQNYCKITNLRGVQCSIYSLDENSSSVYSSSCKLFMFLNGCYNRKESMEEEILKFQEKTLMKSEIRDHLTREFYDAMNRVGNNSSLWIQDPLLDGDASFTDPEKSTMVIYYSDSEETHVEEKDEEDE